MTDQLDKTISTYNWTDAKGNPAGGQSYGIGFTIAWQRGPLGENGERNGAFLLEVLDACLEQLKLFNTAQFACVENLEATEYLNKAIERLEARKARRKEQGSLGTHIPEQATDLKRLISTEDADCLMSGYETESEGHTYERIEHRIAEQDRWSTTTEYVCKDELGNFWSFWNTYGSTEMQEVDESLAFDLEDGKVKMHRVKEEPSIKYVAYAA